MEEGNCVMCGTWAELDSDYCCPSCFGDDIIDELVEND